MYKFFFKRFLDFCISLIALIIISPILLVITIWLHFANKGAGAFFFQERPGKDAKIFKVIKFKTMTDERDADGKLLPDEVRLNSYGKLLRSTSLDELPELFNILKGDMAIIGPRPLAKSYLKYYTDEEHHRHDVRPGLSGLAQVNGRNGLSWEEKFKYDLEYVRNISFLNDARIVIKTIKKVIKREGIGQGEEAPVSLSIERKEQ